MDTTDWTHWDKSCVSGMPLFEVANKNNDNGETKVNMYLKKYILEEKLEEWSLIKTLTHCQNIGHPPEFSYQRKIKKSELGQECVRISG